MKVSKNKGGLIRLFLLFSLLVLAGSLDAAETRQTLATVTKAKGAPSIMRAGTNNFTQLGAGDYLELGDTIKTDANSRVTLLFEDGEIRVITADSNVCFAKSEDYSKVSSVAKVTKTIAETVNAKNLESTIHEAVTGIKISMSSGGSKNEAALKDKEEKKAESASLSVPAADGGATVKEKMVAVDELSKSARLEEREPQAEKMTGPGAPEGGIARTSIPAESAAAASEPAASADTSAQAPPPPPEAPAAAPKPMPAVKSSYVTAPPSQQAPKKTGAGAQPQAQSLVKDWGMWLDAEATVPWSSLIAPSIVSKGVQRISVQAYNAPESITNISDKIKLSGRTGEQLYFTVIIYGAGNSQLQSFKVRFNRDSRTDSFVKAEIEKLGALKKDEPETYAYSKAMIYRRYKYFISALSMLDEIVALSGGKAPAHVIKSRVAIYKEMKEGELSIAEAKKLPVK